MQIRVAHAGANYRIPGCGVNAARALCGFTRVHLTKGDIATVNLDIPAERFCCWDTTKNQHVVEPGKYELLVGGAADDVRVRVSFAVGR